MMNWLIKQYGRWYRRRVLKKVRKALIKGEYNFICKAICDICNLYDFEKINEDYLNTLYLKVQKDYKMDLEYAKKFYNANEDNLNLGWWGYPNYVDRIKYVEYLITIQ